MMEICITYGEIHAIRQRTRPCRAISIARMIISHAKREAFKLGCITPSFHTVREMKDGLAFATTCREYK